MREREIRGLGREEGDTPVQIKLASARGLGMGKWRSASKIHLHKFESGADSEWLVKDGNLEVWRG